MKNFVLEGRITFIDNHNELKICGASTINDDEIDVFYNSFSYTNKNLDHKELNCMFGSPYKIEISGTEKPDFNEYILVKIDSLNTGDGSIAYVFKLIPSDQSSTENAIVKIIIRPENEIIRSLKYCNKYYIKLSLSDREDADF